MSEFKYMTTSHMSQYRSAEFYCTGDAFANIFFASCTGADLGDGFAPVQVFSFGWLSLAENVGNVIDGCIEPKHVSPCGALLVHFPEVLVHLLEALFQLFEVPVHVLEKCVHFMEDVLLH